MKPLLKKELSPFLERFDSFKEGEIRSLELLSPTQISLTLTAQDKARSFDWVSITLEFNGVSDAQLLTEQKLSFMDMSEGITLLSENNQFAFGIGECYNNATLKSSACFIISQNIKYKEAAF